MIPFKPLTLQRGTLAFVHCELNSAVVTCARTPGPLVKANSTPYEA